MREKEVRIIRLLLAFDVKVVGLPALARAIDVGQIVDGPFDLSQVKSYRDPNLEDHLLIPVLKSALSKVYVAVVEVLD
jgi:hypothetical protein